MSDILHRSHVWQPGTGTPLLLLHGTGGNEFTLLPLREHLVPGAPVLSVRGTVLENEMHRFFRRVQEGVFDEDDLRAQADKLAEFLVAAEAKYGVPAGAWVAVGFSNGANMASALLLRRPESLAAAVLLGAMVPFADPGPEDQTLAGKRVLIVNGDQDPMATADQTRTLAANLRRRSAAVEVQGFDGGHTIDPRQLPRIRQFLTDGCA
ncbi:alpha/beta hydrolase [Kribbella sp. NPDC056861]|uniref:alpha/beta hydrolase n=1 Tax=Kribbella sp. NPDC056861 TaxID=3154857 RepID=UPI00343B5DA1